MKSSRILIKNMYGVKERVMMKPGQITVVGNAITKEDQLDLARILIKNGYTVNIKKGKSENGKSVVYINYKEE